RFTDAHAPDGVCTPTRYGLLTGRYCWRTRLKKSVLDGYSRPLIETDRMTVASLLKSAGYRTACVGKWHLGLGWGTKTRLPPDSDPEPEDVDWSKPISGGPAALGFDRFYGIAASLDMPPYAYIENDRVTSAPTDRVAAGPDILRFWRAGEIAPGFRHA